MTEESHKKRSGRGCLWAVVILQSLVILFGIVMILGLAAIGSSLTTWEDERTMGADDFPTMTETWSSGSGDTKVVRIPLQGMIMLGEDRGPFSSALGSADMALASIKRATNDPEVKGLILDIDSGGGGITASDILYEAVKSFKEKDEKRKVIAVFGDVAASGAYYVAAAADFIIARPTSITGSIGVIMQTINIQELAKKIGISDVTIKSGSNKDILNPFKELTPEQAAILQDVVDELHTRFVQIIAVGRDLPEEYVRSFADGRVFTAQKAVEIGLVDKTGYWEETLDEMAGILDVETVKVYRYQEDFSFSSLFGAYSRWDPVRGLLERMPKTRFMYYWQP